jgi:small subunit ribosomal protein S4e
MKRLNAPHHWMLDKMGGTFAPRPSPGPHKLRECFPLVILLRNRLRYALTKREVTLILMQRQVKVDGKVRTDPTFPAGFMDTVQIEKTNDLFRLLYDTKGRFICHRISGSESKYKLGKVKHVEVGKRGIPYLVTHDGRTFRYPDPLIKVSDTVKFDLATGKILEFVRFDTGNLCTITGGRNMGRIGIIEHRERHEGSFDIIHIKDAAGQTFATRSTNVFVIGQGTTSWISLPKRRGIKLNILQEQQHRLNPPTKPKVVKKKKPQKEEAAKGKGKAKSKQ